MALPRAILVSLSEHAGSGSGLASLPYRSISTASGPTIGVDAARAERAGP
ncbi:hypothetical protein [Mycobacterium sp. TY815]|nr:hypothetical protein [Mycobacterium sp. TY815]MDP7705541.1 hypothetical protein [Mycobacterium sp. TY815]